jgi:FMN phosphatase YigB (HAD superfamily)
MKFKDYLESVGEGIHIFCDMDGVLTNWEAHFEAEVGKPYGDPSISRNQSYKISKAFPVEWWTTMPWMDDGKELWEFLSKNFSSLHILSAPTSDPEKKSIIGKKKWLEEKGFYQQLGKENIIITPNKHEHVKENGVSVLIDDTWKKIEKWKEAGGIGIHHTSTKDTIQQLKKHLNI